MNKETVKIIKHGQNKDVSKTKLDLEEPAKNARIDAILAQQSSNKTMAENLANHHFYHINYYWPGCKEAFPQNVQLQHVNKFFPFAEGGPLFVDEAKPADNRDFNLKKSVMKKLGHKYVVITKDMTILEAYEAMA